MTASLGELGRSLRHAQAALALGRAAAGVRDWAGDMADAAPELPLSDALLPDLDIGVLLDPLAASALAAAVTTGLASVADEAPPARLTRIPGRDVQSAAGVRRAPIASQPTDVGERAAGISQLSATQRAAAQPAAQVAALLARHARLVTDLGESKSARSLAQPRPATQKVVPFPLHRAADAQGRTGELLRTGAAGAKRLADLLARWNEAVMGAVARRLMFGELLDQPAWRSEQEIARHDPRRSDERVTASPLAASPTSAVAPADDLVRLRDLVIAAAPGGSRSAPSAKADAAAPPTVATRAAAPEPAASGRIVAALARIEERLAAQTPPPAAPQWLDDDGDLADRVQRILRRQAARHGIDAA